MKKARMNISQFQFILLNLKIFGEIVTTFKVLFKYRQESCKMVGVRASM